MRTIGRMTTTHYDAIVIGSGISGGWAAKELCERGLKTLVLERGRDVQHIKDYPTMSLRRWDFDLRGENPRAWNEANPLISRAAGYDATTRHFFVKDEDHPYVQEKPFLWVRGYQVGGKSLIWGRACARWAPMDFTMPQRLGYGIAWPIGYDDVAPWYGHVENFIGVCGSREGIETMPDGDYLPAYELNAVEQHLRRVLKDKFGRHYVSGRWAHVTEARDIHLRQGRGTCRNRNLCMRGCPFGGYFSSNASTLPWAAKTGNLTVRPHSVVHSVLYDETTKQASGVKVIDANTHEELVFNAKVIFVNASALNSTLILLNSKSQRFPNGLGNDNGLLGKYVGFHNYRAGMGAEIDGFEDAYYEVYKPAESIIPNFRNVHERDADFVGGYVIFTGASRRLIDDNDAHGETIGAKYKEAIGKPGKWTAYMYMQGETVPKASNHVRLSPDKKDRWGIPQLIVSVGYDDNDDRMVDDFLNEGRKMFEAAGFKNIKTNDSHQPPGLDIHEMGGVRMGADANTSLLNARNQMHLCRNVFVTDGACMTSTGSQSPSILYMALTARAANYAADQLKQHGRIA
jgi:choline dehydrogenase-like flavoprotein